MSINTNHTDIKHGFKSLAERDWIQCEVPKKLLNSYEQATTAGPSVEPNYKVMKWLNKNCTGEWRWFYRVLGGYDRVTFLSFEKAQDLFYFRLRF